MQKVSLFLAMGAFTLGAWAQLWYNNGVGVTLTGGVDLTIEGSVENAGTGSYTTNNAADIIHVQGDWTNNTATNNASGPGKIVFEGTTAQIMTNHPTGNSYPNVEVNNGGNGLSLAGGKATLSGNLILTDGKATLNNFDLEASAVTGYSESTGDWVKTNGTGMLILPLSTTATAYPIGNAAYNPARITASAATTDRLGMRVFDDVYDAGLSGTPFPDSVVGKTWVINILGGLAGYTFTEEVWWRTSEEKTLFDRTNSAIGIYSGGSWQKTSTDAAVGSTGPGGSTLNWMQDRAGIDPSLFASDRATAVGSRGHAVPVEWLTFNADRLNADQVRLVWTTASEKDNRGFEIQRRLEGEEEFIPVGFVPGKGNSVNITKYSFVDENNFTGLSYYRLKQIDFSGAFEYSDIRVVKGIEGSRNDELVKGVYNLPNLTVIDLNASKVHMRMLSTDAKLIDQGTYSGRINIDRTSLSKGIYFLHLYTDDGRSWIDRIIIE